MLPFPSSVWLDRAMGLSRLLLSGDGLSQDSLEHESWVLVSSGWRRITSKIWHGLSGYCQGKWVIPLFSGEV